MSARAGPGGALLLAAAVLVAAGCGGGAPQGESGETTDTLAPAGGEAGPAAAPPDTLRGTVEVVGSAPAPMPTLRTGEDDRTVLLRGDAEELLEGLGGVTVEARGELGPPTAIPGAETMQVASFQVLSVGGRPALDGTLEEDPEGGYVLRTAGDEVISVESPPEGMALRVGARIWVVGPPAGPVDSWGVIRPR